MATQRTFNLLKPLPPPKTLWDKIYDWIVSRARVIVLVVVIAMAIIFVIKVGVDTDGKNKMREIETLQSQLQQFATNDEPRFREIIRKEDNYIKLWNTSPAYASVLAEVYSYISNNLSDIQIRIDGDKVSISGNEGLDQLLSLEVAMRTSETFSDVRFDTLTLSKEDIDKGTGQYIIIATISSDKLLRKQI